MLKELVLRWAVPFLLGAVVSGASTFLRMKKKHDHALAEGVKCLLRAQIIAYHDKYAAETFCPLYAKESLKRLYAAYHELGGNDVATGLYEKTMALPTFSGRPEEGRCQ